MDALQHHLAQTLKTQRAARAWSLTQAADATGVSKAMLGQIERGESSPTVATLWKIATGFSLPFSVFIDPTNAAQGEHRSQRGVTGFSQANHAMHVVPLFPYDAQTGFEMLVIELAPGALSESAAHECGVIEHVIVIEGELDLLLDGCWHTLAAGEGLRFEADRPHGYRNRRAAAARFHNLIHYPRRPPAHVRKLT